MNRLLVAALAIAIVKPAPAQDLPPDLLAAHSLGQLAHMLSVASPCFPRQGGDAPLWRMLDAAQARILGNAAQRDAFEHARRLASMQQRYIARSDPVACAQIRAGLQHLTRGP